MNKNWTTTNLIAIGSLTVLEVVLEMMASVITATTGVMFASGVLTTILRPLFVVNALLITNKFGTAFIFMTISGILTLPITLSGPPGFLPKIPVLMSLGLILDLIYAVLKKNKLAAAILIGGVDSLYSAFVLIAVGRLLRVPGMDAALKLVPLPVFIGVLLIMGAIGGLLGIFVYQKIKDTSVVKRMQRQND